MSNKTLDFVNPYPGVAALYKSGMDSVINCLTASSSSSAAGCDCGDVSVEALINCVCDYIVATFGGSTGSTVNKISLKAAVSNAVNGYIDNGSAMNTMLNDLQSVPVSSIGNLFDRLDQTVGASSVLKGPVANRQLALSIGRASFEYWKTKVSLPPGVSPWSPFLDGDKAIDTANIPYWVVAAMFGSQFNFNQDNGEDSESLAYAPVMSLGGALVVGAGKVVFDWVPKNIAYNTNILTSLGRPIRPIQNAEKEVFNWYCFDTNQQIHDWSPCDAGAGSYNTGQDAAAAARAKNPGSKCMAFDSQGNQYI